MDKTTSLKHIKTTYMEETYKDILFVCLECEKKKIDMRLSIIPHCIEHREGYGAEHKDYVVCIGTRQRGWQDIGSLKLD
jgi:hypothetical protein